jgi:Ca-activated chloride channel family protein
MALLWPGFLFLLGIIPLIVGIYIWLMRRRRRFAVRYSSLSLVREALPQTSWLRRYLPLILFLLALAALIIALGRPVAVVSVPTGRANIILAMDVSRSMCSNDIRPNRLLAAEVAALSFVESQESTTQIGIVAFAGFAELIVKPTTDPEVLQDAIESLTTGRRTAIGSAILESLDAIAEIDGTVAPVVRDPSTQIEPTPVPKGAYAPAIVVLLTDGANNTGVEPLAAAQQAVDRGVKVYTIGFGTVQGGVMDCSQSFLGNDPFFGGGGFGGGFGGGGGGFRRGIDEVTLQQIADMTGGTYYAPESADELQEVFKNLPTYLITRHETTEISFAFVAIGALLAALAVILSLLWHPLP